MPTDPNLQALARNTKAVEEATRAIKEMGRILETVNTNLVQLGRIMKENQDG